MSKPLDFTLHLFSIETKAIIFYDINWHTKKVSPCNRSFLMVLQIRRPKEINFI
jgi:hypothetical protein